MRIRVSIVEDNRGTRESLTELLGRAPALRCVGAHPNGEEALRQIPAEAPDVVLMDINLPQHERHRMCRHAQGSSCPRSRC